MATFQLRIQDILRLIAPTALVACLRKDFLQRRPNSKGPIAYGQGRSGEPSRFQSQKHFAPTLSGFANPAFNGQQMFPPVGIHANDD